MGWERERRRRSSTGEGGAPRGSSLSFPEGAFSAARSRRHSLPRLHGPNRRSTHPSTLRLIITSSPFVKMGAYAGLIALTFPDGPPIITMPDADTLMLAYVAMRLPSMPTTFSYVGVAMYASDAAVLPTVLPSAAAVASSASAAAASDSARPPPPPSPPPSPPACSFGNLSGSSASTSSGESPAGGAAPSTSSNSARRYYAITDEQQLPSLMLQVVRARQWACEPHL